MSRLSDLLNPAQSSTRTSNIPPQVDTAKSESSSERIRYPSLASPLEALEIVASGSSSKGLVAESKDPSNFTDRDTTRAVSPQIDHQPVRADTAPTMASLGSDGNTTSITTTIQKVEEPQEQNGEVGRGLEQPLQPEPNVKKEPTEFTFAVAEDTKPLGVDGSHDSSAPMENGIAPPEQAQALPQPATSTSTAQGQSILPTTEGKKQPTKKYENKKKGTANVIKKPAAKKRKMEPLSKDGTPFSQRSGTPNSSRASKTPAFRNQKRTSTTPAQTSPTRSATGADDDDMDDSGELFCICKGPDDHSWMIGCDGECEDWFHGRCVDMRQEDAELVDKYICPNCAEKDMGVTTWKPMCRLERCRKPARVAPPNPSKYCSDEHGEEFMRDRVLRKTLRDDGLPVKRKKPSSMEKDEPEDGSDHQAHLRGGLLRAGELKALAGGAKDASEFRRLGDSVFAPDVASAPSSNGSDVAQANLTALENGEIVCSAEERARLEEMVVRREAMILRMESLADKEKFLGLVKARAGRVLSELNKRLGEGKKKEVMKDMCGFDPRVRWSDEEFDGWRASSEGSSALEGGMLDEPIPVAGEVDGDGDAKMGNRTGTDAEEIGKGVCQKKRCERHKTWYKLQLQELGYEKAETLRQLAKLNEEAKGIGERAMLKKLTAETDASPAGL